MSRIITSTLELALGGSFRHQLVTAANGIMCLPLSEVGEPPIRATDICGLNHAAYVGSTFTRGVVADIPDGALLTTFGAADYVEVLDDGKGIDTPEAQNLNLSLQGGSMGISFLIQTSLDDATLRCLAQKQETDSAGDGWHVGLQNGAIVFFLRVASSTIFNFSRGAVDDGALHHVYCIYKPGGGDDFARIYIDGVASGADVTSVSTEPAFTTANFRSGAFNDGSGPIPAVSLGYVNVDREASTTLAATLDAARDWTTNADVRGAPIDLRYGINGAGVDDNVATPATMTFGLNNLASNSHGLEGSYSPGHANALAGFALGAAVKWTLAGAGVTKTKFRGRIVAIEPLPGIHGPRTVLVTCESWLGVAASTFLSAIPAQTSIRSSDAVKLAIDQAAGRVPPSLSIASGSGIFPFVFDISDGARETILTELTRLVANERGFLYEQGGAGGTFPVVFESRATRQIDNTVDTTLAATDILAGSLSVRHGLGFLTNIVRVTTTPRRVDAAATTVLYSLETDQDVPLIALNETFILEEGYRDPSGQAERVGGTEIVALVSGTDYAFNSQADGAGVDLTADLGVVSTLGGNGFRVEFTNRGSQLGYLSTFQVRGKGVYHYRPVMRERRDAASVREFGPQTIELDLGYESDVNTGASVADNVLATLSSTRGIPGTPRLRANQSEALLATVLNREPGHKIALDESVSAISSSIDAFFLHHVHLTYDRDRILTAEWLLCPSLPATDLWLLGDVGASELGDTTYLGF